MACLSLTLLATIATYLLLSCAHARCEPLSTSGADQAAWAVEQADSGKDFLNADAAIEKLQKETERLGLRIHELEDTLKQQELRSQRKWQENAQVKREMSKELTQLKRMLSRNMSNSDLLSPGNNIQSVINIPVAFSAYLSSSDYNTNANVVIVFDVVFTNEGSCYDKSTGVFTAPISGVYVFSYTIDFLQDKCCVTRSTGGELGQSEGRFSRIQVGPWVTRHTTVALTLEGKVKSLTSSKDTNPGGNVVILTVTKGEKVRIQGMNAGTVASERTWGFTSFSGFLLFVI